MIFSTAGSGIGRALALLVAEVAGARLLAEAPELADAIGHRRRDAAALSGCASRRRGRRGRPSRTAPSGSRSPSAPCRPGAAARLPGSASRPAGRADAACGCRRSRSRRRPAPAPCRCGGPPPSPSPPSIFDDFAPRTFSSRRITLAGLKKCVPITLSGRLVAEAISSTSSVEVLVASTASGLAMRVELGEDLLLDRHLLEHRLDDDVGVRDGLPVGGAR